MITLGIDDLERSIAFYRDALGFSTAGIVGAEFEHGAVAFFDLQQGLKLAVWPRRNLAHDSDLQVSPPSAIEFSPGHNVSGWRRHGRQSGTGHRLGRLRRLLQRSRWTPFGSGV